MAQEVDEALELVRGLVCWGAHWDVDTGLRLNFGEPHLVVVEPWRSSPEGHFSTIYRHAYVEGDWVFWIDAGLRWKASFPGMNPVTGSSSYRRIMMAEARLDGQELLTAEVNPSTGATHLSFDKSTSLVVRRSSRDDDGLLWTLKTPERDFLTVYGNGGFSLSDGESPNPSHMPL